MKIFLVFLFTFVFFFIGISGFWYLTKNEELTKVRMDEYIFGEKPTRIQ